MTGQPAETRRPRNLFRPGALRWLRGSDLNRRPLGYEGNLGPDSAQAAPTRAKRINGFSPVLPWSTLGGIGPGSPRETREAPPRLTVTRSPHPARDPAA